MKNYLLTLGGCNTPNRVYPVARGYDIKDKERLFSYPDLENSFYNFDAVFDYLILENFEENYFHQHPWILVDIHKWIDPKPQGGQIMYIISKKLKNLLEKFQLKASVFYPAKILFNEKKMDYYVWHSKKEYYNNYINFEESTFLGQPDLKPKINIMDKLLKFESKEKFRNIRPLDMLSMGFYNFIFHKAVFMKKFENVDCCFFDKVLPSNSFIISERLKQAIESANIEGVVIKELPFEIEYSDTLNT